MPVSTSDRSDPRTGRARALRRAATPAERKLWRQLNQLEWPRGHFRRQAPIGRFVVDFAHHGLRLVVELDGAHHGFDEEMRKDAARTAFLESGGYEVLRFWNEEVLRNLDGVVDTILAAAAERPPTPVRACGATRPSPPQAGGGERGGKLSTQLSRLLAASEPTILVTIAQAQGSTPREAGAAMLVTFGASHGTIGGGGLEYHAIDTARVMLARGEDVREIDLPLGPLLGQCCGGRVRLDLRRAGAAELDRLAAAETAEHRQRPAVLVFGCGHTGKALAAALAPLPFRTTLVDDRLESVELPDAVALLRLDDPAEAVAAAEPDAAYVVMTHSHALDYRLADAALRRGDAAYVGLIGSATKRARFGRFFRTGGGEAAALTRLVCPIGGAEVDDKRPEVIAALTAAELIRTFAARNDSCLSRTSPVPEPVA